MVAVGDYGYVQDNVFGLAVVEVGIGICRIVDQGATVGVGTFLCFLDTFPKAYGYHVFNLKVISNQKL